MTDLGLWVSNGGSLLLFRSNSRKPGAGFLAGFLVLKMQ